MNYEPKTIADHIDCLARLTGAPHTFIDQVRNLFTNKGIPLTSDAEPFLGALDEAFRREERIRCSTYRARQDLAQVETNFRQVGRSYVDQIAKLKKIQTNLQDQSRRLRRSLQSRESQSTQVTIKGDHRTYVTKPVREELPMVPGPKELQ